MPENAKTLSSGGSYGVASAVGIGFDGGGGAGSGWRGWWREDDPATIPAGLCVECNGSRQTDPGLSVDRAVL